MRKLHIRFMHNELMAANAGSIFLCAFLQLLGISFIALGVHLSNLIPFVSGCILIPIASFGLGKFIVIRQRLKENYKEIMKHL